MPLRVNVNLKCVTVEELVERRKVGLCLGSMALLVQLLQRIARTPCELAADFGRRLRWVDPAVTLGWVTGKGRPQERTLVRSSETVGPSSHNLCVR